MQATDIVAYTYQAETLCPACTLLAVDTYHQVGEDAEVVLGRAARLRGIDRMDESSFDSGDFPKVVFASQIDPVEPWGEHGWHCDSCGEGLI